MVLDGPRQYRATPLLFDRFCHFAQHPVQPPSSNYRRSLAPMRCFHAPKYPAPSNSCRTPYPPRPHQCLRHPHRLWASAINNIHDVLPFLHDQPHVFSVHVITVCPPLGCFPYLSFLFSLFSLLSKKILVTLPSYQLNSSITIDRFITISVNS